MPGMFANVRVLAGPPQATLVIPDVAVQSDQGYKFVYLANQENKVETRPIEVGRNHGPQREVLKGLTPEDRVIVNGLMLLRPGVKVEVPEAKGDAESQPSQREGAKQTAAGPPKPESKP